VRGLETTTLGKRFQHLLWNNLVFLIPTPDLEVGEGEQLRDSRPNFFVLNCCRASGEQCLTRHAPDMSHYKQVKALNLRSGQQSWWDMDDTERNYV